VYFSVDRIADVGGQAIMHGMVIVTPDLEIGKHAARVLW